MKLSQLLKSKTIWVSLATICTGIGMYVSGEQELEELITIIIGTVFGALRIITTSSISEK